MNRRRKRVVIAHERHAPSVKPSGDWRGVNLAQGHPKVQRETVEDGVSYRVLHVSFVAWVGLLVLAFNFTVAFIALVRGDLFRHGERVLQPSFWHFLELGVFAAFSALIVLAATAARYVVTLKPDLITVQWRVLPRLGRTWRLVPGSEVRVLLDKYGAFTGRKSRLSVIVSSPGHGEIGFGKILPHEVKQFLCAAVHEYYSGVSSARTDQGVITS